MRNEEPNKGLTKGLDVRAFVSLMAWRRASGEGWAKDHPIADSSSISSNKARKRKEGSWYELSAVSMPSPPASLTAAARTGRPTHCIPPLRMI
jgi:hypothetical protein